jgi:hypothetical protein
LAVFGPVLLIPITWLIYRFLIKPFFLPRLPSRIKEGIRPFVGIMMSLLIVVATLGLSYFPGKFEFDQLCSEHGEPRVSERVMTDGFFRTRLYPYEANKFLEEDSFSFVEAPHMYKKGGYVRYSRDGSGKVREEEVTEPISRYGVRDHLSRVSHGIIMNEKIVYEIETGKELAKAASITYEGGPLSFLLGVYAMSSCPDVRTGKGSQDFRTYYDLETLVLRSHKKN